jgi:hypothetical protein
MAAGVLTCSYSLSAPTDGDDTQASSHIKLAQRAKEPSVEDKLARYGKVPVELGAAEAEVTGGSAGAGERESGDVDGSERAMTELARLSH